MSENNYMITHWDEKQKPGWPEYKIQNGEWIQNIPKYLERYAQIVEWILTNVEMPYRHSRWKENYGTIIVRFRYERDYLRFILRWS